MKHKSVYLTFLLITLYCFENFAQVDSITYRLNIGVSSINSWKGNFSGYADNIKRPLSGDILDRGIIFRNRLSLSIIAGNKNKYINFMYYHAREGESRTKWMRGVGLFYGIKKQPIKKILFLSTEVGLAYGHVLLNKSLAQEDLAIIIGGNIDIKIWKSLHLGNKFMPSYHLSTNGFALMHTISISYEF